MSTPPHHKMVTTGRKEALWGERAHLPVGRELHGAAFLRKMVKRVWGFRKVGPIGAELWVPSQGGLGLVPLCGQ